MRSHDIVVLTYHSIDSSESVISVSPEMFERQMSSLQAEGYQGLSLKDALAMLKNGDSIPEKRLLITFDDGYQNNLTHALPILKKYGFTATIFITTDRCGHLNDWPNQHTSIPHLPMLSWDEVRVLDHEGIDIGAHTKSHPNLTEVDLGVAEAEIIGSKKVLEDHLGHAVSHFAYPFGKYNNDVKEIVKKNFEGAISTIPGRVNHGVDLYALKRINAAGKIFKVLPFKFLSLGAFGTYLSIKSTLMRVRGFSKN